MQDQKLFINSPPGGVLFVTTLLVSGARRPNYRHFMTSLFCGETDWQRPTRRQDPFQLRHATQKEIIAKIEANNNSRVSKGNQ